MRGQNGFPYPFFYGPKTDGIFQKKGEIDAYTWTNPETGAIKLIQPNAVPGDVRFCRFRRRRLNNSRRLCYD